MSWGENRSGKDAASICKCLERQIPQSDTVSLSAILHLEQLLIQTMSSAFTLL